MHLTSDFVSLPGVTVVDTKVVDTVTWDMEVAQEVAMVEEVIKVDGEDHQGEGK